AQYAPNEELMLLADALSMWDAVDDEQRAAVGGRAALLERAAQIAWVLGDLARACQWADEALAQAPTDDPRRRSTLLTLRAKVSPDWAAPRVGDLLTEAVDLARPGEPSPELAQALVHQAIWHSMRGEEAAAERGAHALIEVGEALHDSRATADGLGVLAIRADTRGDLEQALELNALSMRQADACGAEQTVLMAYVRGSATLLEAGRYADAAAMSAEAHRYATQRGLARLYGRWMSINEAEALEALGRWDDAEAVLRQACAAGATESSDVASRVALARILIRRGEAQADGLLDGLGAVADALLHEPQTWVPLLCCRALSEHAHGRPRQCLALLAETVPGRLDAENLSYWAWDVLPVAAAAMARLDDRDYDAWYDSLRSKARTATSPRKRVAQALADAELAGLRGRPVLLAWRAVLDLEGALPAYEHAYALLRCATAGLHAADLDGDRVDRDEIASWMRQAGRLAEQMGAVPLLAQLRTLARRHHLSEAAIPRQRTGSPASATSARGLTEREQEVLRLVAAGRSNAEIARELYISPKTASVHVSHILAKLDVATRTEAAAVAFREGLVAPSGS
ncbi:MAG: response regulator transcription factor, partial [Jiangellales bacterium]